MVTVGTQHTTWWPEIDRVRVDMLADVVADDPTRH